MLYSANYNYGISDSSHWYLSAFEIIYLSAIIEIYENVA